MKQTINQKILDELKTINEKLDSIIPKKEKKPSSIPSDHTWKIGDFRYYVGRIDKKDEYGNTEEDREILEEIKGRSFRVCQCSLCKKNKL